MNARRFNGRVVVSSVRDEQSGQVVGARMQLIQDICPRGEDPWLRPGTKAAARVRIAQVFSAGHTSQGHAHAQHAECCR